jgi:hypothetical protein
MPFPNRKEDAMEDFVGTWDVEEHTFQGKRTLKDLPVQITIVKNGNQYDVTVPLQGGKSENFTASPNGQTIYHTWPVGNKDYEVRLVFNHKANPAKIVDGIGGSMIALWKHVKQPDDMGTITGTRH